MLIKRYIQMLRVSDPIWPHMQFFKGFMDYLFICFNNVLNFEGKFNPVKSHTILNQSMWEIQKFVVKFSSYIRIIYSIYYCRPE